MKDVHRPLLSAALALAALSVAVPAKAQQAEQVTKALPGVYGVYQCGPQRVTIDSSWEFSAGIYDGAHYFAQQKTLNDLGDRYGIPPGQYFPNGGLNRGWKPNLPAFGFIPYEYHSLTYEYQIQVHHIWRYLLISGNNRWECFKQN